MNRTLVRAALLLLALVTIVLADRLIAANAGDRPTDTGPAVVILKELEDAYEPVPFDHLSHAKMAEMWHGCQTCHHRSPQVNTGDMGTTATPVLAHTQDEAAEIPACKSCHPIAAAETDIHMPSLKGAYHRQCLNCHKEWMHENACVICHKPKDATQVTQGAPSPGDIVGRMHPPIPEPDVVTYRTRFTPADGPNVMFRHREHTINFGAKCVNCHYEDNCSHCHSPGGDSMAEKPLKPGMTWNASHGPCMDCHIKDRCEHCHYRDDAPSTTPFDHNITGQGLDEDHAGLGCMNCHSQWAPDVATGCGDASCHAGKELSYPTYLPGPLMTAKPGTAEKPQETGATTSGGSNEP